jgi:hypothetical protein
MKHLHVSAIPSTPITLRYSHRDTGETYAFTERDAIHVEPYLSISDSFCGMSQWSILGAGVREQA